MTDLPYGWALTTLGEIAETMLGKMLDRKEYTGEHAVPYLRNVNVQWGQIDLDDVLTMDIHPDQRDIYELRQDDLLICEGGEVGRCAVWRSPSGYMAFQKALHRVRPYGGIDSIYLRYLLEHLSSSGQLARFTTGSTIKHLPQEQLRKIPVPMAPLGEQRRIVEVLESCLSRLDAGAAVLDRLALRTSSLVQSATHLGVCGELSQRGSESLDVWVENLRTKRSELSSRDRRPAQASTIPGYILPTGWRMLSLDSLSYASSYGTSTKCDHGAAGDPVLRIPNIRNGEVDLRDIKKAVDETVDLSGFYVSPGDILFIRTNGSPNLIGRAAIVRDSLEYAFASYLIRFRLVSKDILPEWVLTVVSSPLWRSYLQEKSASSAGQYNLSAQALSSVPIPLPPRDEIVDILASLDQLRSFTAKVDNELAQGKRRACLMRKSLLAQAFEGRLVPQDPSDEHASELLKRIRQNTSLRATRKRPTIRTRSKTHTPELDAMPIPLPITNPPTQETLL
ncbi:restriction endonuclease subunit S [Nonomuraea sp. NPDC049649]|uniref:restriction endonuclease subunit S n=1 Tax=Nonomuraea sp. NPDC049649 TaxID=3155776 RepID=UPI00342D4BA5